MGKAKHPPMGGYYTPNLNRLFTILNWDKIGEGINNANVTESHSFYAVRIGSLGGMIIHREIDEESRVTIEITNKDDTEQVEHKVWIGSIAFQSPEELLDIFTNVLLSKGWI